MEGSRVRWTAWLSELSDALTKEIRRKYGVAPTRSMVESGDLWLFQLEPTG